MRFLFVTSKLITCFIDGFTSKREFQSIVHLLTMNWNIHYILDFGPWRWSALNMGYMNKQPSIPVKDNRHEGQSQWRTRMTKDKHNEGQEWRRTIAVKDNTILSDLISWNVYEYFCESRRYQLNYYKINILKIKR